ncbi:GntR family transcriptional regulator [Granulicella sp. dw_53]|uniref:GntR family transcriptional regulator n=1 Tax=Granulicella sp. dw_53 TaxID=2719792 RepID=UPI001BD6C15D|nr:GntR family transcriptional regulator [Granulicella sp. dw_53]
MPKADAVNPRTTPALRRKPDLALVEPSLPLEQTAPKATEEIYKSVRDRIRWTLLKRISEGVYRPGERLKELKLAQEFHVSQAPVREAFRELETLGVLISEHYRGTRVREISNRETQEAYHLRGYLEEIAAQLIPLERLQDEIANIEALQETMRGAALSGDMDGFARANVQFHRTIVSLAPNQMLLKVWESLEIGMRSQLTLQKKLSTMHLLAELHQPIVDSLKLQDLKQTGVLLREHSFSFLKEWT